jgi:hypothetical protein
MTLYLVCCCVPRTKRGVRSAGRRYPDPQVIKDAVADHGRSAPAGYGIDRAKRHDLLWTATADRVVRFDQMNRRSQRAIRALAIVASELRRLAATEAAGLIEVAHQEVVRTNELAG